MGSYSVTDITKLSPKPINYFLDANVWLIILKGSPKVSADKQAYIDFFDAICNLKDTISSRKKNENVPSIVVSPLLISELFNRYTRISFNEWKDELIASGKLTKEQAAKKEYKKHYRKESHYDDYVSAFKSDFLAYKDYITLMDDVAKVDPFHLLKNFPANTDFNDVYYYTFCYENKIPIVTNDGDFLFSHVEIITNLPSLLGASHQEKKP